MCTTTLSRAGTCLWELSLGLGLGALLVPVHVQLPQKAAWVEEEDMCGSALAWRREGQK